MSELETETVMHLAHAYLAAELGPLFYAATGLNEAWAVPADAGGPDPSAEAVCGRRFCQRVWIRFVFRA